MGDGKFPRPTAAGAKVGQGAGAGTLGAYDMASDTRCGGGGNGSDGDGGDGMGGLAVIAS